MSPVSLDPPAFGQPVAEPPTWTLGTCPVGVYARQVSTKTRIDPKGQN